MTNSSLTLEGYVFVCLFEKVEETKGRLKILRLIRVVFTFLVYKR